MKIIIKTIPHSEQRLGQAGDWWFEANGDLQVRVSDVGDWRMEFLYARHEMDEAMLCKHAGITTEMVDEGDAELDRKGATNDPESFSGYPGSVYQNQHNDALASEWQMSRLLGVDWDDYGVKYDHLWDERPGADRKDGAQQGYGG
jgi:hypothetical protein